MAKLGIFTGTSPNDTTGDTLSQGAVKINSNFSEIYTALGDGTNITNSLSTITVAGLSTFTNGPVLIGSATLTGTANQKLQVTGGAYVSDRLLIGTSSARAAAQITSNLQVEGSGSSYDGYCINLIGNSNVNLLNAPALILSRSRGTSNGSVTAVTNGDRLGSIAFTGANGSNLSNVGAIIECYVDGTVTGGGADDMPCRLVFSTTSGSDSVAGSTDRMMIDSSGNLGIGTNIIDTYTHGGTNIITQIYNSRTAADSQAHILLGSGAASQANSSVGSISWGLPTSTATNHGIAYISATTGANSTLANPTGKIFFATRTTTDSTFISRAILDETGNLILGVISRSTVGSGTANQKLQVTGGAYVSDSVGIGTTNPSKKLHVVGDVQVDGTITGTFSGNLSNAVDAQNVKGGIGSITQLQVSGISTFTNGPILVGRATTTGTANQALQVESGVYISGNLGIGTTNPSEKLSVYGAVESLYDTRNEGGQFILRGKPGTGYRWNIDNYTDGIASANLFRIFKEDNSSDTNGRVYVGITTIGEFIIGDGSGGLSPTGTANQQLQVQSGSYIQNNLGIGITNPTSSLSVNGSTVIGTEILNMTGLSSTFTTVGNNTFVVPTGVTKISAVLIAGGGAGGGSGGGAGGNGGGGGGLVYINDYPVSPGQTLTVVVGGGGVAVSGNAGGDGGNSSITGIAAAFGGKGGSATANAPVSLGGSGFVESNVVNSRISNGGSSGEGTNTTGGGGGGSAGYSGNGGSGGSSGGTPSGAGSGGGAGGGSQGNGMFGGNGGGGTGILGQGSFGASGGVGGSGGANGVIASSPTGSNGGNYGGGGGGADGATGSSQIGGNGGQGVVRIIWSPSSKFSRLFPTNQVGNNINQ